MPAPSAPSSPLSPAAMVLPGWPSVYPAVKRKRYGPANRTPAAARAALVKELAIVPPYGSAYRLEPGCSVRPRLAFSAAAADGSTPIPTVAAIAPPALRYVARSIVVHPAGRSCACAAGSRAAWQVVLGAMPTSVAVVVLPATSGY